MTAEVQIAKDLLSASGKQDVNDKKDLKELLDCELRHLLSNKTTKESVQSAYYLVKLGADRHTHFSNPDRCPLLTSVVHFGDLEWFKKFVEEFNFDAKILDYELDEAISCRRVEIVRWLIQKLQISQEDLKNKFYRLCTYNQNSLADSAIEIAKVFFEFGASIHYESYSCENMAQCARNCMREDNAFCQFLKEKEEEEKTKKAMLKEIREGSLGAMSLTIEELNKEKAALIKENANLSQEIRTLKSDKTNDTIAKQNASLIAEIMESLHKENERLLKKEKTLNELTISLSNLLLISTT